MKSEMLTTSQAAARLGVGRSTVNLWCRQGKFPNAEARVEVIGTVWYIPESDLEGFQKPKMGRPPKAKAGDGAKSTSQKYGTIESQTATTRKLNRAFRQAVEEEMAGRKKGNK